MRGFRIFTAVPRIYAVKDGILSLKMGLCKRLLLINSALFQSLFQRITSAFSNEDIIDIML